ncbi:GH11844 [Drosophila grimshawi]|uniref:GH11844 n=1 Tax=Drosophila grimshawi TaxID=7222 RepID=B4JLM6_DROGR|nr:GH11844 [Drosophila grimshawi]
MGKGSMQPRTDLPGEWGNGERGMEMGGWGLGHLAEFYLCNEPSTKKHGNRK